MANTFTFKIQFVKGVFPTDTRAKIKFFDGQELDFDVYNILEMTFEMSFESGENKKDAARVGNRAFKKIWQDKKVTWQRDIPQNDPERTWLEVWLSHDLPPFGAINASVDEFGNVKELYLPQPLTITPSEGYLPIGGTAQVRVLLTANPFIFNVDLANLVKTKVNLLTFSETLHGSGTFFLYQHVWLPESLRVGEDPSRRAALEQAFSMTVNSAELSSRLAAEGWKCKIDQVSPFYAEITCSGEDVPYTTMYEYRDRKLARIEGEDLPDQALAVSPADEEIEEMYVLGEETGLFVVIADPVEWEDYSVDENTEKEFLKTPKREKYLKIMRYATHAAVRLEDGGMIP